MRPYFSVGEEVIFVSQNFPQYSGEYTIKAVGDIEIFEIISTGEIVQDISYDIGLAIGRHKKCAQRSLRKKHEPADQSFQELIKSTRELKV